MYDAAMDRIKRWSPKLKDHFERAAPGKKVKHTAPASLEKRAAVDKRQREISAGYNPGLCLGEFFADKQQREGQWAFAKASRRCTSALPSFARKRKCQDEAPVRATKRACHAAKDKVKHKPPAVKPKREIKVSRCLLP